ncbi:MAG: hypothetical protein WD824_17080 [Cyclobacteriaceae bacterium]
MKKIISMALPRLMFAIAIVLCLNSCQNKNASSSAEIPDPIVSDSSPDNRSGSKYILASSLALRAEIENPNADQTSLRTLFTLSQNENADEPSQDAFIACCCPCYQTFSVKLPVNQPLEEPLNEGDPVEDFESMTLKDSTGHCECPSMMQIIARNSQGLTASIGGQDLVSEKQTGKMEGWTVFKIDEKALKPGKKHVLKIQGKFFGEGLQKYELPFFIDKGRKPYLFDK